MEEAEVARRLAEKSAPAPQPALPAAKVEEERGEKSPQPESGLEPDTPQDPLQHFLNKQSIMQHFGVTPSAYDNSNDSYVENILQFAERETGSSDPATLLNYINNVERQMGNQLSNNRLQKFHQFVTIRNQVRLLQEKERALVNG